MRKHESETTEYIPTPEESTYHTGSAKPHAEHRGLIAVLMILVTFLGGIASALGIVNIQLLQALNQEHNPEENVSVFFDPDSSNNPIASTISGTEPVLPAGNSVEVQVAENGEDLPLQQITPQEILVKNGACTVTVHCEGCTFYGVVADSAGFIVTNAFPICENSPIYVTLESGQRYRATLVGSDRFTDLAVLYINATHLTPAQFASARCLTTGDFVACLSQDGQISTGALAEKGDYAIGGQRIPLLQADLPALSGPLFNGCGQIIGFLSPALSGTDSATAIPSSIVKDVVEQLIGYGFMDGRPCLGVEMEEVQPLHQQYFQLPQGLRVTHAAATEDPHSSLMQGDILICLNHQRIYDHTSLCAVLRNLQEGDTVTAVVIRDNVEVTIQVLICSSGQ